MSDDGNGRDRLDGFLGAWWRMMGRRAGPLWIVLVVLVLAAVAIPLSTWRSLLGGAEPPRLSRLFVVVSLPLLGALFALGRWRRRRSHRSFLEGLQSPTPDAVIAIIDEIATRTAALPDADAVAAHTRAIVHVFYGQEAEAVHALAAIHWGSRAALIQGVGLAAEGLMETFCRHDPERALVLHRRSRQLAEVGAGVPGAAQSDRFHAACVAVAEVALGAATSHNTRALEEGYADARYPLLQLLSAFGLAVAVEARGDAARARALRTFIQVVAPHCTPLHFVPGVPVEEVPVPAAVREAQPVTASIAAGGNAAAVAQVGRTAARPVAVRPLLFVGLVAITVLLVVLHLLGFGH